jgi:hypothetical protein
MNIELIDYNDDYCLDRNGGSWVVCKDELSEFFDLSDNPHKITLKLTKRPKINSYFVKVIDHNDIEVELSDKTTCIVGVYWAFSDLLTSNFPKGCYISVVA